jgi:hypothetical protein
MTSTVLAVTGIPTPADLAAVLDRVPANDRDFANGLLESARKRERNGDTITPKMSHWIGELYRRATTPAAPAKTFAMTAIYAMFAKASENGLKRPAIVLNAPDGLGGYWLFRLSVATGGRFPGAINVTSEGSYYDRAWFGRIHTDGRWEPSRKVSTNAIDNITGVLEAFAADPEGVAAAHGKLTGKCCFCNRKLTDKRSTDVGYGPICAGKFGRAWG